MTKGPLLAEGRTAEIFAWGENQALKLLRPGFSPDAIHTEAAKTRAVHQTGFTVPAVGEMVEVDGRQGILFERIEGVSMLHGLVNRPWTVVRVSRQLAQLHAEMHACSAPALPPQRKRMESKIKRAARLSDEVKGAVLEVLAQLPEGDSVCHGDFHPDNILLTARGPVIIDWIDATQGNPLADVARTLLLVTGGALPPEMPRRWVFTLIRRIFRRVYLGRYFQLRPGGQDQLASWALPVAAGRLDEGIAEEEENLVTRVEAGLRALR